MPLSELRLREDKSSGHKLVIIRGYLMANVKLFSGGSEGKESACTAGDLGLIPGSGTFPGEGNGYPL